eukprot:TRINITY_DN28631_c0_g1_i1.p1 TRINITY_DN28631_c0_g1~~TRINITY_DN28631_c0_g1_i1.p1  ORF type:complete len:312 (+),score=56.79 TRINITY_DN28631_c0_g1_i1:154-1089(+)
MSRNSWLPGRGHQEADLWTIPADLLQLLPTSVTERLASELGGTMQVARNLDCLDLFAGAARISWWGEKIGLNVCALDKKYGEHMDILTLAGYVLFIIATLRVRRGGLIFCGPQCSSWVWVGRSTTGRSKQDPMGNLSVESVVAGNTLNARLATLLLMAFSQGVTFVVEQPVSSLFFTTPVFSKLIAVTKAARVFFHMQDYGHDLQKGTVLYGTAAWLPDMAPVKTQKKGKAKSKPRAANRKVSKKPAAQKPNKASKRKPQKVMSCERRVDSVTGKVRVYGIKNKLKESAVYPPGFALKVIQSHWPGAFAAA